MKTELQFDLQLRTPRGVLLPVFFTLAGASHPARAEVPLDLAKCTLGWYSIIENARPKRRVDAIKIAHDRGHYRHSTAAARELYREPRFSWITDQVIDALRRRGT